MTGVVDRLEHLHTEYEVDYSVYQTGGELQGQYRSFKRTFTDANEAKAHVREAVMLSEEFARSNEKRYQGLDMVTPITFSEREVFASPWKSRKVL